MAEQQLVDYIKKAREAGQADDQTSSLLYKNGWTEAEVKDAFAITTRPQPQAEPQSQPQPQPQPVTVVDSQPKVVAQPQTQPQTQPEPEPQLQAKPQPQPQPQPKIVSQPEPQYKPRSSHLVIKLLMVLIIVVVLGGIGYSVAGQYFNLPYSSILLNLFSPNPETVINEMVAKMKDVKSSHMNLKIEASADNLPQKLSIAFDGDSDVTDVNNPKANFTLSANIMMSADPAINSAVVGISMIAADNASYLKINDLTGVPSSADLDVSKIKGKWFKIDEDSIKALSQLQEVQISMVEASKVNTSDLTKKIQDLVASENILSNVKKLNSETINGQDTYHYLVNISKEKLISLINKLIDSQIQDASKIIDAIGDINIEMWIGKKDFLLYQTKIEKTIDTNKIIPGAIMKLTLKFDATSSNFNNPIVVQAPTGTQKIETVLLPLLGEQYNATWKLSTIKGKMAQIRVSAESAYKDNKSYSSLCNSGLLNGYLATYGTGLIILNNDIVAQGAKKPRCFSKDDGFCISTQLADGTYLCIGDKTTGTGSTRCVSAQTVCK